MCPYVNRCTCTGIRFLKSAKTVATGRVTFWESSAKHGSDIGRQYVQTEESSYFLLKFVVRALKVGLLFTYRLRQVHVQTRELWPTSVILLPLWRVHND